MRGGVQPRTSGHDGWRPRAADGRYRRAGSHRSFDFVRTHRLSLLPRSSPRSCRSRRCRGCLERGRRVRHHRRLCRSFDANASAWGPVQVRGQHRGSERRARPDPDQAGLHSRPFRQKTRWVGCPVPEIVSATRRLSETANSQTDGLPEPDQEGRRPTTRTRPTSRETGTRLRARTRTTASHPASSYYAAGSQDQVIGPRARPRRGLQAHAERIEHVRPRFGGSCRRAAGATTTASRSAA